ncbi:DUF2993 domain-containing protein [Microbacterium sp. BK668]|uniref:LmeA family phospholipid-binding protein n=1 Tax=Microbacterium sp. BK668 TaxID=2512118 RepID=UPI00105F5769|nr:DUF2993 domain-containing protein [Microbacterium sp. BK668]TDN88507.1 DUF2993 family protein [Microbacterium sp. BK668]
MTVGDTQPTQPLPDWTTAPPEPRRRRRAWPWILAAAIVIGLAVAAWFLGESIARGIVEKTIRDQVVTSLALPADQEVDVEVAGTVIPQLVAGTLDDVTVSSDDVSFGEFSGDVTVHATGIGIRGEPEADAATATVRLDENELKALLAGVQDFPVDSLSLASPDLAVSTELQFLGIAVPIGVSLTPSAADGDIVLTPSSLQVAGAEVSADDLTSRFGAIADTVLKDYTVCIAQYIPAGLTLTQVQVDGDHVVADFDVDGRIASDPALRENGTCDA